MSSYLKIQCSRVGRGGRDRFVRADELESDDRLPLVSRSNPVAATFALICKFEKEISPSTKFIVVEIDLYNIASERITLA